MKPLDPALVLLLSIIVSAPVIALVAYLATTLLPDLMGLPGLP